MAPVARRGSAAGPARVAVVTLGCKVNQFDSASLVGRLQREGLEPVAFSGDADIFVVNTCSVTARADLEARQWIRRARRLNPEGTVIVTGCYAASGRATLEAMPEVDLVAGVQERERIYKLLRDRGFVEGDRLACQAAADPFMDFEEATFGGRTRAFLKVQDGCNAFCTFCVIPYTRGRSRSTPPARVVHQVARLAEQGFREVVLTGINLSTYGRDLKPRTDLRSLLEQIEAQGVPGRLRLSSVEPTGFTDGLIALLGRSRLLCPHQHIPLQSGDDAVLRRMNRRRSSRHLRKASITGRRRGRHHR
ncbi:MAG: MiaB/RimO family radical SAM methylthiotransferase, partial [Deltaproteobacteria bacterium]|nr:MiaB/RimO family radical SAM methylthiotransferase [Deltaproteobacteria bacterium]